MVHPIVKGGKVMDKKPLIGVSILAVVLLVLGSLSNVVGYQTVQTSQQNLINERINQRELLFQTIVDIANNKEIQRIILKSQMSRGIFPTSEIPVVTKQQIRQMYFLGMILSKIISKSMMQSKIGKYQIDNKEAQKEISIIIEKNPTLKIEISQLQNSTCDCENNQYFPKICEILTVLVNIFDNLPFPPSYLLYLVTLPFIFVVVILYCFVFNCVN
jgi:hypothetical protein